MNIQYISDNLGNKTAVVISMQDWRKFTQKYAELKTDFEDSTKVISKVSQLDEKILSNTYLTWIEDAENSPKMSLENFNEKWKQKKVELQKLIP